MRRLISAFVFALALCAPAFAGSDEASPAGPPPGCVEPSIAIAHPKTATLHLAQSSCRGDCSSRRGYCMSSCRDGQCRAICNDIYQSCLSSCR